MPRSQAQSSPAAQARLISSTLQSAASIRDPLTFASTLCASIVQGVDTAQYSPGVLVLAVLAVPDDESFKALLMSRIPLDKVLTYLCDAASHRRHEVSYVRIEPQRWQVVAQCVWEDLVKKLDLRAAIAQVNAWLEFGQVEYEGLWRVPLPSLDEAHFGEHLPCVFDPTGSELQRRATANVCATRVTRCAALAQWMYGADSKRRMFNKLMGVSHTTPILPLTCLSTKFT